MKPIPPKNNAVLHTQRHFLRNFLIIFLSALVALSAVLFGFSIYRSTHTYMRYGGTFCDAPTYRYLASYYKLMHMRALAGVDGAEDTEAFWQSIDPETKKTQGALLAEGTKNYISRVLICASLFDGTASADQKRTAKNAAKKAAEEILTYQANADKETFDALAAPYGFAYEDLADIALLLYKAANAQSLFYGASGETASTRVAECDQYLKNNYSAVRILFIRTKTTYFVDEDGNADLDENQNPILRDLSSVEIEQREQLMADLDQRIAANNLLEDYFKGKMDNHYENYAEGHSGIYYFSDNSAYTQSFRQAGGEEIVRTALSIPQNSCKKLSYADGYCYVFKLQTKTGAFAEESYETYFSDFYENVASYLFSKDVALFMDDVVITERAKAVSLTALPYENLIRVRF